MRGELFVPDKQPDAHKGYRPSAASPPFLRAFIYEAKYPVATGGWVGAPSPPLCPSREVHPRQEPRGCLHPRAVPEHRAAPSAGIRHPCPQHGEVPTGHMQALGGLQKFLVSLGRTDTVASSILQAHRVAMLVHRLPPCKSLSLPVVPGTEAEHQCHLSLHLSWYFHTAELREQ